MKVRIPCHLFIYSALVMVVCSVTLRVWAAPTEHHHPRDHVRRWCGKHGRVGQRDHVDGIGERWCCSSYLRAGEVLGDVSAPYCTDIYLLGTEQLSSAGIATLKFVPGVGSHSYKAVFVGTTSFATSASGDAGLMVTPTTKYPTTATIAYSGNVGSYTLTATVTAATGGLTSPTGTVSFLDTSNGNAVLGTAARGAGPAGLSFSNSSNSATAIYPRSVAVGDFNGDGIPDLAVGNLQEDGVTILLGNGDGTFTVAPSVEPGNNYFSTSVAGRISMGMARQT